MAVKDMTARLALAAAPYAYQAAAWLFFGTCRVEHSGPGLPVFSGMGSFISAIWHCNVLYVPLWCRGRTGVVMISGSSDGEYIARILSHLGIDAVRGSRHRGGLGALKQMIKIMREKNYGSGIVADGSQGPARIAQPGAILLSSRTGAPIVPTCWAARRYRTFASWDRTILPLPFTRIVVGYGEPMTVPPELGVAEMEPYRRELEERLNCLYSELWGRFGRQGH